MSAHVGTRSASDGAPRPSQREQAIVYDGNADALLRRRGVVAQLAPQREVIATSSPVALQLLATLAPADTPIFVDLCASDRASLDRPGIRIIERLAHGPATAHVRPIAWSAYLAADVIDAARAAGARGFVTATLRLDVEAEEIAQALSGQSPWPVVAMVTDAWDAWFEHEYRAPWRPWMEPILVRLAETSERRSIAGELVRLAAARSEPNAQARMRDVARIIAGEHSASPIVVAERAEFVLAQLAAYRPLDERPAPAASLQLAAEALRTKPSLALAAGLTALEVDDIEALDELIRAAEASTDRAPGAPPSDKVRAERRWAAGRLAARRGAKVDDVDVAILSILHRLDAALLALDDASRDASPAPRAAAALLAALQLAEHDSAVFPEVLGTASWRGRAIPQLALASDIPDDELRAFTAQVDAWLVAHRRSGA